MFPRGALLCARYSAKRVRSDANADSLRADSVSKCSGRSTTAARCSRCGGSSIITCALVPLRPKEFKPAMRRLSDRSHGMGCVAIFIDAPSSSRCAGSGTRKCRVRRECARVRGRVPVLISPATPAAASRWPTLVFTEPTTRGLLGRPRGAEDGGQRMRFDGVAELGSGAVGLDIVDRFGGEAGVGEGLGGSGLPGRRRWARSGRCCGHPD